HEYSVDPLRRTEAVELFLTRAVAVRRDFTANGEVAQICERLDDLPLAIELAAARVRLLSPRALLERLEQRLPLLSGGSRDAPDRQRTLRATIEWSHELLTADEQRLFARLAVFRGGWRLEAAEGIAEADLDTLQSLVDKSLVRVRPESGRFWMLETIREFAAERLEASGETDDIRRRHADHFLALAEEAEPHVRHDSLEWLDRLQAERDNLRAALDHMEAQGDGAGVTRLTGSLWRFWYQKSHFLEGRRRLETALHSDDRPTDARAKALHGASVMTFNLGDTSSSRAYAEQALALEETLGNRWGVAYAGMMLGNNLAGARDESRDLAAARDRFQESARLFEEIGDEHYALISRHNQAIWITGDLGDRDGERRLHEESLAKARSLGNQGIEAEALAQLGMLARDDGRLEDAAAMIRQAIRLDHQRGMVLHIATDIGRLASILVRLDQPERAATLVGSSEALTGGLGADVAWWAVERNIETIELATAKVPQTAFEDVVAAGRRLTVDEAVALALEEPEP
ncbi:MAG: hypothetical protein H0V04_06695, partial [Chloroflexi bacterium]|nr:hypothetical protein [Chloroflexota bacterium]